MRGLGKEMADATFSTGAPTFSNLDDICSVPLRQKHQQSYKMKKSFTFKVDIRPFPLTSGGSSVV